MIRLSEVTPDAGEIGRRLLAVQHAAYAVEAGLIGDDRIPPLHESLDDLLAAGLAWLGAYDGDRLVGAVAWSETPSLLDIDRLIVDPRELRKGIGRSLVTELLSRASGRRTEVSTGQKNTPARTLYERLGFTSTGDLEVIPGLWITNYTHA